MKVFLIAIAFCFGFSKCSVAQNVTQDEINEIGLRTNQITIRLSLLNSMARSPTSDLEFTPEQKEQLRELRERHQQAVLEAREIQDVNARMMFFSTKLGAFDKEISKEILLPHQEAILDGKVFNMNLQASGGNFAEAIILGFARNGLEFNTEQKKLLEALRAETKKRLDDAREKFEKEVGEIRSDSENKLAKILTNEQMEKIRELNKSTGQE